MGITFIDQRAIGADQPSADRPDDCLARDQDEVAVEDGIAPGPFGEPTGRMVTLLSLYQSIAGPAATMEEIGPHAHPRERHMVSFAIATLALATAAIHASLGGVLFTANALGYAVLATAILLPARVVRVPWLIRVALAGFTGVTIVGWILIGSRTEVAYLDKAIEVALITLLAFESWRHRDHRRRADCPSPHRTCPLDGLQRMSVPRARDGKEAACRDATSEPLVVPDALGPVAGLSAYEGRFERDGTHLASLETSGRRGTIGRTSNESNAAQEADVREPGGHISIREADTIWREEGGWFDARWHFSFDRYRDPEQMGVGALRVFNDDRIVAGAEWPLHPHHDIESLTYVVEGRFLHDDSLGNNGHLEPGAAQVMTFSHRGDQHSEKNGSPDEAMRFIQFWILPSVQGLETRVQQRQYRLEDRTDRWLQIMGPPGTDGLDLAQDARALVAHLTERGTLEHAFGPGRGGYLYVIDGRLSLEGESLRTGDAAKITGEAELRLTSDVAAELILVDVPLEFEAVGVWASR